MLGCRKMANVNFAEGGQDNDRTAQTSLSCSKLFQSNFDSFAKQSVVATVAQRTFQDWSLQGWICSTGKCYCTTESYEHACCM